MKVYEIRYMAEKIAKAINNADLKQSTGVVAEFYGNNNASKKLFKTFLHQELKKLGWSDDHIKRVEIRGCYISLRN